MPVSYDDTIKKPNATVEYTQHMISEIEKCSKDFFYFCKYVKVIHPDKGKIIFDPRWYQKDLLQKILDNRFFCGLCARQTGKCETGDTAITIREKNTGKIEQITIEEFYNKIS